MKTYYIVLIILFALSAFSINELKKAYNEEKVKYISQCACIDNLLAKGIERRNIVTKRGRCQYKENGYYKM